MLTANLDYLEKSSKNSFCKIYTFEHKDKSHLGTLFLILEINIAKQEAQKIGEILSEILEFEYFRKEENVAKNFEFALNRANQAMSALAEEGHIEWLNKLHALVGVIYDTEIHLAVCGKASVLLLRGEETINIVEGLSSAGPQSTLAMKTFVNIISGQLKQKDKLLFATPRVFDYFSKEKIKRILAKSPFQARKDFLADISSEFEPMGLLFVEIKEGLHVPTLQKMPLTKPSPRPSLALPQKVTSQKPPQTKLGLAKTKEFMAKNLKGVQNFTLSLFNRFKFKKQETSLGQKPSQVQFKLPKEKGVLWEQILKFSKKMAALISQKFQRLTPLSKVLLVVALLFIIAFVVNISRASLKKKDRKVNTQYENAIKIAAEKEKLASDALIYNDYKKAKGLLQEAKGLVEKDILPSKKHKTEGEKLLSKIQEDFDKVDKIIRIKNLQTLIDLEAARLEINDIISINKNIYTFDSKKNDLYKFDENTKTFISLAKSNLGKILLIAGNESKNTILLLTAKPDLSEFIIDTKNFQDLDIAFANDLAPTQIKDINAYMERLYVLVPSANQIYRHQRTISGYSKGSEWFLDTKNLNIKEAVSFAIDGSVYILKSNGEILKFLNAEKEEFTMPELLTPITSPTKIYTDVDCEFVYILEPKEKRVVVLDKKGGLKNQYISDEFANSKGIYVSEKEKKMYLLTDKKLLGTVLEK